jgi:nicotinamide phosphoribosyltransferase
MYVNPLTSIDFYKADHRRQYPKGTSLVYSNFTPRSNKLSNLPNNNDHIVFFGLQYFIKYFLEDCFAQGFFSQAKKDVVKAYKRRMDNALGKDAIPVDHIEALHDLGYLPIEIRALPEGSKVDMRVPCVTIHNTKPEFYWLVNYLETILSSFLWKSCVSATTAAWYRNLFDKYCKETGGDNTFVPFQGHDFSFRGMSGVQDAALSGAGHLLSFVGTDTVPAIDFMEQYYNANSDQMLVGCSVPATEHSVMCMGSEKGEYETFKRLVTELYPKGIVSIVSDTWDFWNVLTDYLPKLKEVIMAREGKVVIRPDSGDPVKIICGDPDAMKDTPTYHGAVETLWRTFGGTVNAKGFKLLDPHIGIIYGDSITPERAETILAKLKEKGFASTNIVFGIGSFTYNFVTRDTYGFAVKATYGEVNGVGRDIFKQPKTDDGTKNSARGILAVRKGKLYDKQNSLDVESDLKTVFVDGVLKVDENLSTIRKRLKGE